MTFPPHPMICPSIRVAKQRPSLVPNVLSHDFPVDRYLFPVTALCSSMNDFLDGRPGNPTTKLHGWPFAFKFLRVACSITRSSGSNSGGAPNAPLITLRQARYDTRHAQDETNPCGNATVNGTAGQIFSSAQYYRLRSPGLLRFAVVGYLSRQQCLMIHSLDPMLKRKRHRTSIARLVNRTKYTDNLVLDERRKENNQGYPNRG
jgi:hypothetical protein